MWTAGHMNIDNSNAYCGLWLVYSPCLAQGRIYSFIELSCTEIRLDESLSVILKVRSNYWDRKRVWHFVVKLSCLCKSFRISFFDFTLSNLTTSLIAYCYDQKECDLNTFFLFHSRLEIRQDDPLNLSILISGGKENNSDAFSNGEWNRQSPALNRCSIRACGM